MRKNTLCESVWVLFAVLLVSASAHSSVPAELAKVNGKTITTADFERALSGFTTAQRNTILKDTQSKLQILNNMVEQDLLFQEGEKIKLDQTKEFKEAMEAYRKQLVSSQMIKKNVAGDLTDRAAKKYYEANRSRYSSDIAKAQQILLDSETDAQNVKKLAQVPNADFSSLALKYSKEPTVKKTKGELNPFGRDIYVKEFTDAVFNSKPGEVVGPVKTPFGYHIIKVQEIKLGTTYKYDEVEFRVKGDLQQELIQNYINKLRKTAHISMNNKVLEKISP